MRQLHRIQSSKKALRIKTGETIKYFVRMTRQHPKIFWLTTGAKGNKAPQEFEEIPGMNDYLTIE